MGRTQLPYLVAAVSCALLAGLSGKGETRGEASPTTDRVIYAKGDALWSIPSTGGESAVLATLPVPASEVSRIRVAASGTAMLVTYGGVNAWADLSVRDKTVVLRALPCAPNSKANISANGDEVICPTQTGDRIAIYHLRPVVKVKIIDAPNYGSVFFSGSDAVPVGFSSDGGLRNLDSGASLATHHPDRPMRATPKGNRAIGGYGESDIDVVYSFRLDGKAVKRTLMQAARAVSISAGSEWASLQQEVDACAVRISGGQYMCWRKYEAVDVSRDARSMLLSRAGEKVGHDLFLGSISGTSARKPTPLVESVERASAFWSDPMMSADATATSSEVPVPSAQAEQ